MAMPAPAPAPAAPIATRTDRAGQTATEEGHPAEAAAATEQEPSRRHRPGRWSPGQWRAVLVMYPVYLAALFARASLDASLPAMLTDTSLGCTPADTAAMLSTGVGFYSVGKLLGGSVTDWLGAPLTFTATVFNGGVMMVLTSLSRSMRPMSLWWGLSRLGGACFWPSMMKLTSSWFDEQGFGGAWSVLTTSSRVGAIVGGLTAGAVMRQRWGSWRAILRISGALQLLMAGVMALLLRSGPVTRAQRPKSADSGGGGGGGGYLVALRALLTHRRVALTFMAQACVLPLLELNSLLPLYLVQTAGVRSATASTLATSYPLGGIIGMLFTVRGCWYGCG
eukprot:SAG25_NODE_923_length_4749_cov_2.689032_6_plen_337_part_00